MFQGAAAAVGAAATEVVQQLNPINIGAQAVGQCMPLPMRARRPREVDDNIAWTKAGLPADFITTHPDFVQALVTSRLHRVLARRGEALGRDVAGEPLLLVEGVATPWRTVKATYTFERNVITNRQGLRCAYLVDGLTVWDSAQWGMMGMTMRPAYRLPESARPSQPQLHVLMARDDEHAWCRLIDVNGDVTTFGAAIDADAYKHYGPLLNTVVGTVNCPDPYDVMDFPVDVRCLKLTEESAQDVRQFVEARAHDGTTFNWLNRNCNTFTTAIVERASGERPPTFTSPQGYVMRHGILAGFIPEPARPVVDFMVFAATLGFNPLVQGATTLLGGVLASNPQGERYLEHPLQLMTPLMFTDPDKLRDWIQGGGDDSWSENLRKDLPRGSE